MYFTKVRLSLRIAPVKFHETSYIMKMKKRPYRLKARAENRNRTRQKIVEAAIELHQAKGIAATSMNDIAERAEVGKVTVYRHFADEAALLGACSGLYFQRHPFPDPEDWRRIEDPIDRLRRGLGETYAYHRATEPMIARVLPEARGLPIMVPYDDHWRRCAEILTEGWQTTRHQKVLLNAALTLALSFDTWRLLVREQGLTDRQAVELMLRLTCDCEAKET